MIWLRRFFAVFLGILFIPLLFVTLIVLRSNDTLLSADFYVNQLRKADLFNFLYDEALPAAVDEIEPTDVAGTSVVLRPLADRGVVALRGVFPPEWLQEGDSYTLLFDDVITPIADYRLDQLKDEETGELPCGLTMSSEDIVLAIQPVASSQWLQGRVEHVTDELVPYLAGEAESFAIHLPLADRIEKSLAGGNAPVKVLLRDIDAYEKVYRNCVIPKPESTDAERPWGWNKG